MQALGTDLAEGSGLGTGGRVMQVSRVIGLSLLLEVFPGVVVVMLRQ